jgi:hypothetical protein
MSQPIVPELATEFLFWKRPVSIPADLRPGWRMGIILLLLRKCCKQQRSSFARLHMLNWAIRTAQAQNTIIRVVEGELALDALLVRYEPSLNRAVDLAIGEQLIKRVSGDHIELTTLGIQIAEEIDNSENTYVQEKQFMSRIGKRLTEKLVNQTLGWWENIATPTA